MTVVSLVPQATTDTATQWWLGHAERMGPPWVTHYWNDWEAPHRQQIVLALGLIGPVASLYEIGCNSGPNLRLIRRYFPALTLGGMDRVPMAADFARDHLSLPITQGTLPRDLPDAPWDVVLSCYTLAYLDPRDARATLQRLAGIAQTALILAEPCVGGPLHAGQCRDDGLPEWRHDYAALLRPFGWRMTWKWPMVPPVENLNALLVLERGHA